MAPRMAKARASADFPLATSPPSAIRSPRRKPPPSILSRLGKPQLTVSGAAEPSATASTRERSTDRGEMSALRGMAQNTVRYGSGGGDHVRTALCHKSLRFECALETRELGPRTGVQVAVADDQHLAERFGYRTRVEGR